MRLLRLRKPIGSCDADFLTAWLIACDDWSPFFGCPHFPKAPKNLLLAGTVAMGVPCQSQTPTFH
jgi:hypothetical protein